MIRSEYAWVGAAFVVSVLVAFPVLQGVMTRNFDRLERQNVAGQAHRISSALNDQRALIHEFVLTNSQWDDAYAAIASRDRGAAAQAFVPEQMRSAFGFGGVVLLDRAGVVVGGGIIGRGGYASVSPSLATGLAKPAVRAGGVRCGVLAASESHYLYCSAPVLHTDGSGPAAGTPVVVRTLDASGAAALGRLAGLSLTVAKGIPRGAAGRLASELGTLGVQTRAIGGQKMSLLVAVPAIDHDPPLVLQAAFGRPVHQAAVQSAVTSAEIIGVLGIALLLISILVSAPAGDLAVLADSVNGLLEVMTERQLQAQRESEAMAAERATTAAGQRETEAWIQREREQAAAEAERERELAAVEAQRAREQAAESLACHGVVGVST